VKRLIALLAIGAAIAAVLAVPSVAVDTKGPPCADIVFGDGSYAYYGADGITPLANPYVEWTFELAAPACKVVTYSLEVYDLQETSKLATVEPTSVSGTSVVFRYTFATGTAPSDGVCLAGTTSLGPHVADRALDEGCLPLPPGSGGGQTFQ
jgi:hypothetical protein